MLRLTSNEEKQSAPLLCRLLSRWHIKPLWPNHGDKMQQNPTNHMTLHAKAKVCSKNSSAETRPRQTTHPHD